MVCSNHEKFFVRRSTRNIIECVYLAIIPWILYLAVFIIIFHFFWFNTTRVWYCSARLSLCQSKSNPIAANFTNSFQQIWFLFGFVWSDRVDQLWASPLQMRSMFQGLKWKLKLRVSMTTLHTDAFWSFSFQSTLWGEIFTFCFVDLNYFCKI